MTASVDYEPAESTTSLFGGNSNWRGPIWFPVNYLVISASRPVRATLRRRSHRRVSRTDRASSERWPGSPTTYGSGSCRSSCPATTASGRCSPGATTPDPTWADRLQFHEYFHGDDGRGLGASHQTGWTGLVADLVIRLVERSRGSSDDARGARRPLRRDRRRVRGLLERRRRRRACACSTPAAPRRATRWSSTRASSGAAASTGCRPARATATGSMDRMTRRPALAATRPSCCSIRTRGRSPARCSGTTRSTATTRLTRRPTCRARSSATTRLTGAASAGRTPRSSTR